MNFCTRWRIEFAAFDISLHSIANYMENSFTAVFEKLNDWYIGYVQELPGANVQERTLQEARESLREAIELILISNRELAEQQLSGKDVVREQITVEI